MIDHRVDAFALRLFLPGWYLTDEFPFHLRMVPDLLDGTRSWKSESPNLQSKFSREYID